MEETTTRLIVNLTPLSMDALKFAATLGLDTRTDTVNRALQVYAYVMREQALGREWSVSEPKRLPRLARLLRLRATRQTKVTFS